MSVVLQDQAVALIRERFTPKEVFEVKPYAGEFAAEEILRSQFKCPAVLVGVLGWGPNAGSDFFQHPRSRTVVMAAFVVVDQAERVARMRAAASLSDKLDLVLRDWRPDGDEGSAELPADLACPQPDSIVAENLYGRAADKAGMALWMVRWRQSVLPREGAGGLIDWLGIDIESTVKAVHEQGPAPETPPPLPVTHGIDFQQDTPPTD